AVFQRDGLAANLLHTAQLKGELAAGVPFGAAAARYHDIVGSVGGDVDVGNGGERRGAHVVVLSDRRALLVDDHDDRRQRLDFGGDIDGDDVTFAGKEPERLQVIVRVQSGRGNAPDRNRTVDPIVLREDGGAVQQRSDQASAESNTQHDNAERSEDRPISNSKGVFHVHSANYSSADGGSL